MKYIAFYGSEYNYLFAEVGEATFNKNGYYSAILGKVYAQRFPSDDRREYKAGDKVTTQLGEIYSNFYEAVERFMELIFEER